MGLNAFNIGGWNFMNGTVNGNKMQYYNIPGLFSYQNANSNGNRVEQTSIGPVSVAKGCINGNDFKSIDLFNGGGMMQQSPYGCYNNSANSIMPLLQMLHRLG